MNSSMCLAYRKAEISRISEYSSATILFQELPVTSSQSSKGKNSKSSKSSKSETLRVPATLADFGTSSWERRTPQPY